MSCDIFVSAYVYISSAHGWVGSVWKYGNSTGRECGGEKFCSAATSTSTSFMLNIKGCEGVILTLLWTASHKHV